MLGLRATVLAAVCWAALAPAPVLATDRWFSDLRVESPDGRLVISATSPDNEGGQPFADGFTYVLKEAPSGRVRWTRDQPVGEGSPVRLFLHDSGHVVVHTSADHLLLLDPVNGEPRLDLGILDQFGDNERRTYVQMSSAGNLWAWHARWRFLRLDDGLYFVMDTWWQRRLVIDVAAAEIVDEPGAALRRAADDDIRRWAVETLRRAADALPEWEGEDEWERPDWAEDAKTAVHWAGRLRIREAIKPLRTLQHAGWFSMTLNGSDRGATYRRAEVLFHSCVFLTFRARVHLALRQLGEWPEPLPCTLHRAIGEEGYIPAGPLPAQRRTRVERLSRGDRPRTVLDTIGAPDFIGVKRAWDYDIDDDVPYTLRLHWTPERRVARIQIIRPAVWEQGDARYFELR